MPTTANISVLRVFLGIVLFLHFASTVVFKPEPPLHPHHSREAQDGKSLFLWAFETAICSLCHLRRHCRIREEQAQTQ